MPGFMTALSKYAQFWGRSRRREYWGFTVTTWLIGIVIGLLYGIGLAMQGDDGGFSLLALIAIMAGIVVGLGLILPTIAVGWRRCQDVGIPGAVAIIGLFIPLVVYVIGLIPGTDGENAYGPDPRA